MKKIIIALLLIVSVLGLAVVGCSKDEAVWLKDGQTLKIVDNTLGEGKEHNIKFTRSYSNSVVNEEKGYVYVLPVSESNPTERYFVSLSQGGSGNQTIFVEITNVKSGDKLTGENSVADFGSLWGQGLIFAGGDSSNANEHYSSVVTTTKYCYNATKNNNIKVWGDKYLAVTVTSSVVSASPINFTVEIKNFLQFPMILTHEGDSWQVV